MLNLAIHSESQAIAGGIYTENIRYPSENEVSYLEVDTFIICGTCPEPGSLIIKPTFPLVIRESGSKVIAPEILAQLNEPLIETKIKKQTTPQPEEPIRPQKHTIHFTFDSDILTPDSIERLGEILKMINTTKNKKSVTLSGYTSDIGSDTYNANLSIQRALAVERFFQTKGFQATRVSGKGSCCPISNKRSLNQRVEIVVE